MSYHEGSDEEEFYDALDVFDKDVIEILKLDANFQKIQDSDE